MKSYTKSHMTMHIIMSNNTHDKSCKLKLNNIDCYINCHVKFSANFNTQFSFHSIIEKQSK